MTSKIMTLILTTLFSVGCEARVLDSDGSSLKDPLASLNNIETSGKTVAIKDLNVKGVIPYIDMETGKVTYDKHELKGHELSIEVDFSVFQVFVKLGENYENGMKVEALNSGVKDFHAVTIAPESDYLQDSENNSLVIGNKFYDGGNGWTGFHMTKNVYVLKTRSGKFAKVQFLKAKQGNVDLQYFIQTDGSTNLKTQGEGH